MREGARGALDEDGGRLLERREMLAEFGTAALHATDLESLLNDACRLITLAMGETMAKVVEIVPGQSDLLVRASVGFDEPRQGYVHMPAGRGSSPGYALMTGEPVLCRDTARETRFELSDMVRRAGVRSAINVPVPDVASPGAWYGVLEVDSREVDAFDEGEVAFLTLYANVIAAAVSQQRVRGKLEEALERADRLVDEKQRLLQELQHRIKNNLAVVTGFVRIQKSRAEGEEAKDSLEAIGHRIETLRLVHARLYAAQASDEVDSRTI